MTARLLAATAPDLATHAQRNGALPWRGGPGRLAGELEASGLTGRGGAGFPAWRKLLAAGRGQRPVVVANAAEGEPASAKDATLLAHAPHLVLDGLQLLAEAVSAERAVVYVKRGAGAASVRRAVAERQDTWDRWAVEVVDAPDTFVAGEASAVVAALEGRPAVPRHRDRSLAEKGVRGRPTLLHNAETVAHVALIARHGPAWFRRAGTAAEPGTLLATVSGAVAAPGVAEVGYGTPLGDVLAEAGGAVAPLRALLVGGYHGAWLPADAAVALPLSRAALAPWGASPGAGVVVALGGAQCGIDLTARIAGYLAAQSARQCGPCINGLPRVADTLRHLAAGRPWPGAAVEAERLAGIVDGRGACHHPDGTARLVRSALRTFADDVEAHLAGTCTVAALATGRP